MTSGTTAFDVENVEYLRHGALSLQARLYRPRGAGPFPAMVELHGGVWTENDRTRSKAHHECLARHGIAVAALDFRQGAGGYPHSLADINFAIRWLKANPGMLATRADLIGICGSSSGGHLAMLSAMRPADPRYCAIPLPDGGSKVDASVRCVVLFWPVIDPLGRHHNARRLNESANPPDWPPRTMQLSMAYWGSEDAMREGSPLLALERAEKIAMPPVLWIQGNNDLIHDYVDPISGFAGGQSHRFVDRYRKAGGTAEVRHYEAPLHFSSEHPQLPQSIAAMSEVTRFIHSNIPVRHA